MIELPDVAPQPKTRPDNRPHHRRGYVLDQGQNAYTGTGKELLNDPKVIELYLGTLVKTHQ